MSSVCDAAPDLAGTVMLTISQSGASADPLAVVSRAREAGARIIALVNAPGSPLAQLAAELTQQGADVLLAGTHVAGTTELPTEGAHPVIEPLLFAQSFYRMANALSLARGLDPDRATHLAK